MLPPPPKKSWKTPEEVRQFLESIAKKLQVTESSDWYRVGVDQMKQLGGNFLIRFIEFRIFLIVLIFFHEAHSRYR
jgi:hypothetical protein